MKFYIASAISAVKQGYFVRCREALKKLGHEIILDWSLLLSDEALKDENDFRQMAESEKNAVKECDFLVFIRPGGRGSHIEMGLALAYKKPVFMLYDQEPENDLFNDKDDVIFYLCHGITHCKNIDGLLTSDTLLSFSKKNS